MIRIKIIISFIVTAVIILISYAVFLGIKSHRDRLLRLDFQKEQVSRTTRTLMLYEQHLENLVCDFGNWDEMVGFSTHPDSMWSRSNLSTVPGIHRLTGIWVFNRTDSLVYSVGGTSTLPDLSSLFTVGFFSRLREQRSLVCFHEQSGSFFQIAASSIHPTQGNAVLTESSGTFLLAKVIDRPALEILGELSGARVRIVKSFSVDNEAGSDAEIKTRHPLVSWDGKIIGYMEFRQFQPQLQSLISITNTTSLFYLLLALVMLTGFSFIFYRWLNNPLKKIAESLSLESSEPIQPLISKKNEFSEIAIMIDRFFRQKTELAEIIREKNEALSSLKDAEAKNKAILSAIPDNLFRLNIFGIITDYQIRHPAEFNIDQRDLVGNPFEKIMPLHPIPQIRQALQEVNQTGNPFSFEFTAASVNHQEKYFEATITKTSEGDYLAVVRDISSRREAEKALNRMLEKEAELNRLKTQFINTVSHEFRTPLSVISSNLQLLALYDEKWSAEKKQLVSDRVRNAVAQMTILLEDLSVAARDQSGKFQMFPVGFDLHDFCKEMVNEALAVAGPSREIRMEPGEIGHFVRMDKQLLRYILINLLNNALKFSQPGTQVTFSYLKKEADSIAFIITDQGIGIPQDEQELIFEPFHRAKNSSEFQGTGLGLSVVKRCVEMHQGTISVNSIPGRGTIITVILPQIQLQNPD